MNYDTLSNKNTISVFIVFVSSAMVFVIALAWNEAFKDLFESNKELKKYGPWVYAILVTLIGVFIINIFSKMKKN